MAQLFRVSVQSQPYEPTLVPCVAFKHFWGCPRKLIFDMPPYFDSVAFGFFLQFFMASVLSLPPGATLFSGVFG